MARKGDESSAEGSFDATDTRLSALQALDHWHHRPADSRRRLTLVATSTPPTTRCTAIRKAGSSTATTTVARDHLPNDEASTKLIFLVFNRLPGALIWGGSVNWLCLDFRAAYTIGEVAVAYEGVQDLRDRTLRV